MAKNVPLWQYALAFVAMIYIIYPKQTKKWSSIIAPSDPAMLWTLEEKNATKEENDKRYYVTADLYTVEVGAGIGNQMFEIASLYGIADYLEMQPFVPLRLTTHMEKLQKEFPAFNPLILNESATYNIRYFNRCCSYENLTVLKSALRKNGKTIKNVTLNGLYFQSYRYFDHIRPNIQQMFAFRDDVRMQAANVIDSAFRNYNSLSHESNNFETAFKEGKKPIMVCAHIRRGDFVKDPQLLESTEHFTKQAVNFVRKEVVRNGSLPLFLIVGNDPKWAREVFPDTADVFIPETPADRTVDLAILAHHCDIIILTASGSTFGIWGAYLSDKATVYYNKKYAKPNFNWYAMQFTPTDVYPRSWKSLLFVEKTTSPPTSFEQLSDFSNLKER